ncbi:hypothetical protein Q5R05_02005 [Leuconostoc carnosum]|uniref:hypothetical protein n=1 Tax=Leuconostoc carnosum TaxID=1252 RepID=UPI000D50EB0F|nr:hypothetical protein [Leuconostoc carnosum]WLC97606.1 hypothetical protein Q5R05_08085 [Leuconostoc carnosum]WLC98159.1 hypothetical protein Q5R05_02005 [Leuconostoc carnosum]SPJ44078.1 hypothetical protein LCAC16_80162 [Leuconostoc carnosum]
MSEKSYIQVEIPKVPRWLSNILSECQTKDYSEFKTMVGLRCCDREVREDLKIYLETHNKKDVDLAIALGVWEIEDNGR